MRVTLTSAAGLGLMAMVAAAASRATLAAPDGVQPASPSTAKTTQAPASPAAMMFAQFKKLDGQWHGKSTKGWKSVVTYETIAGGSCVMEREDIDAVQGQIMATMFHMDGPDLLLTHYCAAKNQPRMKATEFSADGKTVLFTFKDGTNLPSRDVGHMDKAEFTFADDDHLSARWTWYQDGKEQWMEKMDFVRAPKAAKDSKADSTGQNGKSEKIEKDAAVEKSPASVARPTDASRAVETKNTQGAAIMASPVGYNGGLTCAIQVKDLAKSMKWYQDIMGFTMLYKIDEMGWAELATETKGVNIGLSQVEKITGTGNCKLTFGVHDIDKTRKMLEAKGVKFTGETITIPDMVKLATFEDPDHNVHMFFQELAKH